MGKLEKEVKILDINKTMLEKTLRELGAEKLEESLQKIYVYDLPSIYARFYDCIMQLKNCKRNYEYEVCRSKLEGILKEVDNLTTDERQGELEKSKGTRLLGTLLNKTSNEELLNQFSDKNIVDIIKEYGINPNKWVRLRSTNGKTTITIKHILNPKIQKENEDGIQKVMENEMENEMEVPSIEEGNSILEQLGFSYRNYQEKQRATYSIDGVEVDIDTWPLIPTYVEIENDSEELIRATINKLGLQNHEIVSCNTAKVYEKYGIDLYKYRTLKFDGKKQMLKDRKETV